MRQIITIVTAAVVAAMSTGCATKVITQDRDITLTASREVPPIGKFYIVNDRPTGLDYLVLVGPGGSALTPMPKTTQEITPEDVRKAIENMNNTSKRMDEGKDAPKQKLPIK